MKRCRLFPITTAAALTLAGCGGPPQIIPVGPPGVAFERVPVNPDTEAPAALGESATQAKSLATTPAVATDAKVAAPSTKVGETATLPSGLKYTTLVEGTGAEAKPGQNLSIHYVGTLAKDGTEFDSSRKRGQPYDVQIGTGQVIPGWDEGVPGMKVGEKRKLEIPANLAYGSQDKGEIPPDSDLVFEVELVGIK